MAKRKTSLTNKQKRQLVSLLIAVLIAVLGYIGTSNKLSPNNPIKQVASLVSENPITPSNQMAQQVGQSHATRATRRDGDDQLRQESTRKRYRMEWGWCLYC